MSFKISADFSDMEKYLDGLDEGAVKGARPAAQAGIQVLYDEVRRNVPVGKKAHWFHGTSFRINGTKYRFDAGTLRDGIYQVFSQDNSSDGVATYHVSWNYKKVPYGFMVEHGTARAAGVGFLRRAANKLPQALDAAEAELMKHIDRVI